MRKTWSLVITLGLGAVATVVAVALKQQDVAVLGASPPPVEEWKIGGGAVAIGLLYYVLTLSGILLGSLFESLSSMSEDHKLSFSQVIALLGSVRAWKGLIASPLIFLVVYMAVRTAPFSIPFVVLAFQNGFFWKAVMSRLAEESHLTSTSH